MSNLIVTVCNTNGTRLTELTPAVDRVSWRLNQTGEAVFSLPYETADPDIIKLGNRILIEFDNGLPDWGGVIDAPLGQRDNGLSVKALQADRLLSWRHTTQTEAWSDERGGIAEDLIQAANGIDATGIIAYNINPAGETLSLIYHYTELLTAVRELTDAQDYEIVPELVGGQLQLRLNWYEQLGSDKSDTILLEHGKNITSAPIDWQGDIWNDVTVVGGSGDWSGRTVKTATDGDSVNLYGRRQKTLIYADVTDATTLQALADSFLAANKDPRVQATLTARNQLPATFTQYSVGDIVTLLAYPDRQNWAFEGAVRIIARQWNNDDTCTLEVKQWLS